MERKLKREWPAEGHDPEAGQIGEAAGGNPKPTQLTSSGAETMVKPPNPLVTSSAEPPRAPAVSSSLLVPSRTNDLR